MVAKKKAEAEAKKVTAENLRKAEAEAEAKKAEEAEAHASKIAEAVLEDLTPSANNAINEFIDVVEADE